MSDYLYTHPYYRGLSVSEDCGKYGVPCVGGPWRDVARAETELGQRVLRGLVILPRRGVPARLVVLHRHLDNLHRPHLQQCQHRSVMIMMSD